MKSFTVLVLLVIVFSLSCSSPIVERGVEEEGDSQGVVTPAKEVVEEAEEVIEEVEAPAEEEPEIEENVRPVGEQVPGDYVVPGTVGLKDSGKIYVNGLFPGGEADLPITIYNGLPREKVYVLSLVNIAEDNLTEGYALGVDYAARWIRFPDVMRVPGNSEKTTLVNLSLPKDAEVKDSKWEFWIRLTEVTEQQVLIAYDSKVFVHMAE